ncbi:MAG: murein biosynthesis integral membrane protein MurJ [Chloroflexota bacterium]
MAVEPTPGRTPNLARSTIIVMLSFAAAKAISLLQTFVIARAFGVSADYDAFVTANKVPEQIFNLIAGGALAFAFIPVFTGLLARDQRDAAWRTASYVINTVFMVTLVVSAIAFITAPWLIANVVAPGFDLASQEQTVTMMRILLVSTLIFSVSGIWMGILQSHNLFLLPALAPIMFDVGILFGVLVLIPRMGVHGIAVGAVIGAAMHLGIQIPGMFKVRLRWTPRLGWNDPELRRIIRLMIPRIADLGVVSLLTIITTNILSRLGTGAASAFDWGWRLMQIPETLIGTAMGIVIFPTLSALSSLGDVSGKRDAMSGAVRFILISTIPSAIGLILIGRPMISLLERGAFDASASDLVYSTLQFFALGIVVHSVLEVIARSFYADKDTFTPLVAAIGGFLVNLVVAVVASNVLTVERHAIFNLLAGTFGVLGLKATSGNVGALALANTLGVAFEVVLLMVILRRRWHGLNENAMAQTTLKTLAASLAMGLVVVVVGAVWTMLGWDNRGFIFTVAQIGVQVTLGGLVFLGTALLLRMDELRTLLALVLRRRPLVEAAA